MCSFEALLGLSRELTSPTKLNLPLAGSSRGSRAFIQQELVQWAKDNPAVEAETNIKRNKHPVVIGEYRKSVPNSTSVKTVVFKSNLRFPLVRCSLGKTQGDLREKHGR